MILIYSPQKTPRLEYILKFIFNNIYDVQFNIVSDKDEFISSNLPKINYSTRHFESCIHIEPVDLLFESNILQKKMEVSEWNGGKIFFETHSEADIPF
ncbi:MAG: hypothetical protein R6V16_08360, partial [Bacteroidales bacterium]